MRPRHPGASRRDILRGAAAAGAACAVTSRAAARGPMLGTQAPSYYRFKLGAAEVTVVSDGPLPLGDPAGTFLGVSKEEVGRLLTENFLPADNVVLEQNVPVVNFGDRIALFDTGMGTNRMFGATTGRLQASLREAGLDPKGVDAVVCSHAHIDHIGGIVGDDGAPLFPNAQIYLSQADFDFWTDEAKLGTPLKAFVEAARRNLLPVRDRLVFFKDEQEFLPGIQAIAAPGHTVGHTCFMVGSGGASFCFVGDLTHHHVLLVERPRTEFAYDTDPKRAVASRLRLLDMLAANRIPMMSYHFPWPGLGHVAKAGEGFRYYAAPMRMVPG